MSRAIGQTFSDDALKCTIGTEEMSNGIDRGLIGGTIITMAVTFDPAKRDLTLKHLGLDFARAGEVFAGQTATVADDRIDYGETRLITGGYLDGRLVVTVWTP